MKRILTGVVGMGALATLLVASLAHAANIRVETPETATSPAVVTVTGRIDKTDYNAFVAITARIERATVFFHSEGGWLADAMRMATLIQRRGYNTAVGNHQFCYSACAIAWLAGKKRFLGIPAAVGFHAPYNDKGEEIPKMVPILTGYLHQFGISDSVAAKLLTPGRPSPKDIMVFVRDNIDGGLRGQALAAR